MIGHVDDLIPPFLPLDDLDLAPFHFKVLGQEFNEGGISFAIDGWSG